MAYRDRSNRFQQSLTPGTPVVFKLSEGGKVLSGHLIITGTLRITGGTANGTLLGEGGPINLIRRITIQANRLGTSKYPGGKIVDCTPRGLLEYAISQRNGKKFGEISGSTIGSGAIGNYPIYLSIPIYFADNAQRSTTMTALNMDKGSYASVQVIVETYPDLTGCFTGNDRSIATSSLMCQWRDDRLGLTGDCTPIYQEDHIAQIPAANTRFVDAALPQDGAFVQWLIMAEQGTSQTLADTILNRVTLEGPSIRMDEYANDIRQQMFNDEWLDPAQAAAGLFFVDFSDGVQQANNNVAPGLLAQFDVNNPSGASLDQLRIYTRRIFPLATS